VSASFFHSSSPATTGNELYIYDMPPKAEYWILSKEEFTTIKARINEVGDRLLENLKQDGFTKIKSSNDWLGLTVEKKENDLLTFVAFCLRRESPKEFQLFLRKWNVNNQSETCIDLYEKKYNSIDEFQASSDKDVKEIKDSLHSPSQQEPKN
jgi:hypothetical protein